MIVEEEKTKGRGKRSCLFWDSPQAPSTRPKGDVCGLGPQAARLQAPHRSAQTVANSYGIIISWTTTRTRSTVSVLTCIIRWHLIGRCCEVCNVDRSAKVVAKANIERFCWKRTTPLVLGKPVYLMGSFSDKLIILNYTASIVESK